ncbi:MAG: lysophospholipid acyltransferase family protein [Pyrinomonadaceae bacterium]|nr:lysophospholipid acyltransferase family protein [Pyrinomonadaceae bacterium]
MPKKRSKFQAKIEELAVRLILRAIGIFPYGVSLRIGKFIGKMVVSLFPKLSKTANRNLEIAFLDITEAEKHKIIKGTFESLGRQLGFVSQFRKFKHEDIRERIEIVGREENFDPADKTGRGILFFTGHFGSWEVFNLLAPAFGYGMNILVRRIDNELVEKYVDSLRTKFGAVTIDKKRSARKMYRLLEQGKILGILADLNVQEKEGIFVNFFGIPASTTTSIAKLALKTNAIIMPAFAVWVEEKQKYVVYVEPPIEFEKTGDSRKDILDITQKITAVVENFVRKYPEQWLWIHKRWNTRPKGQKGFY